MTTPQNVKPGAPTHGLSQPVLQAWGLHEGSQIPFVGTQPLDHTLGGTEKRGEAGRRCRWGPPGKQVAKGKLGVGLGEAECLREMEAGDQGDREGLAGAC